MGRNSITFDISFVFRNIKKMFQTKIEWFRKGHNLTLLVFS